jgi:hypothetical protein
LWKIIFLKQLSSSTPLHHKRKNEPNKGLLPNSKVGHHKHNQVTYKGIKSTMMALKKYNDYLPIGRWLGRSMVVGCIK